MKQSENLIYTMIVLQTMLKISMETYEVVDLLSRFDN